MAKAVQVARKSRTKVSEILTSAGVHQREAVRILAKEEEETEKKRKRDVRRAKVQSVGVFPQMKAYLQIMQPAAKGSAPVTKNTA